MNAFVFFSRESQGTFAYNDEDDGDNVFNDDDDDDVNSNVMKMKITYFEEDYDKNLGKTGERRNKSNK